MAVGSESNGSRSSTRSSASHGSLPTGRSRFPLGFILHVITSPTRHWKFLCLQSYIDGARRFGGSPDSSSRPPRSSRHAPQPPRASQASEIDSAECAYFGLFPQFDGIRTARITPGPGDGATIRLTLRGDGATHDTMLLLDHETATELGLYLDNFEAIYRRQGDIQWHLLRAIARPCDPLPQESYLLDIRLRDSTLITGGLLHADDSTIVVWKGANEFSWRDTSVMEVITVADIEEMRDHDLHTTPDIVAGIVTSAGGCLLLLNNVGDIGSHSIDILTLAATALFPAFIGMNEASNRHRVCIGGNLEAFRLAIEERREKAVFQSMPPPEIRHALARARIRRTSPTPLTTGELADRMPRAKGWTIAASSGFRLDITSPATYRSVPNRLYGIEAGHAIGHRLELSLTYLIASSEIGPIPLQSWTMGFRSLSAGLRFRMTPGNSDIDSGISLSMAADIGPSFVTTNDGEITTHTTLPMVDISARLGCRFSNAFGVWLDSRAMVMRGIPVDPVSYGDKATTINLSGIGLMLGLSCRL